MASNSNQGSPNTQALPTLTLFLSSQVDGVFFNPVTIERHRHGNAATAARWCYPCNFSKARSSPAKSVRPTSRPTLLDRELQMARHQQPEFSRIIITLTQRYKKSTTSIRHKRRRRNSSPRRDTATTRATRRPPPAQ